MASPAVSKDRRALLPSRRRLIGNLPRVDQSRRATAADESTLDEAIEKANALPCGLAGDAFTRSAGNTDRLADRLEVGSLSINHFVASVAEGARAAPKACGATTIVRNVSHRMM